MTATSPPHGDAVAVMRNVYRVKPGRRMPTTGTVQAKRTKQHTAKCDETVSGVQARRNSDYEQSRHRAGYHMILPLIPLRAGDAGRASKAYRPPRKVSCGKRSSPSGYARQRQHHACANSGAGSSYPRHLIRCASVRRVEWRQSSRRCGE